MSVQDMFYREGIPTMAAFNAIDSGVDLMHEYLKVKPLHIHPLTNTRGAPSWFIVQSHNPDGVKEMIGWRKEVTPTGKSVYKGPDHWLDTQRYIINSRPTPPSHTITDMVTMSTHDQLMNRTHQAWVKRFHDSARPENEGAWF